MFLGFGCAAPESPCPPQTLGAWSSEGEAEVFVGDDLFIYINGGAEVYHEYGFVQVAVQRFRRGDDSISAEIYTMAGDAYGIYSFARSQSGYAVDLGDGATSADYYLHFWSGSDLVVITAENEFDDLGESVLQIATGIAECLSPGGIEPVLITRLPTEDRVEGSEVYFTGRLAFLNVARPVAHLFSGFEEGASARLKSGEQFVLLRYADDAGATRAIQAACEAAEEAGGSAAETEDGAVELSTGKHLISVNGSDNLITIRVDGEAS